MFYHSVVMALHHPVHVARWIHRRFRFPGPPANFAAVLAEYPIELDFRDWRPDLSGICVRGRTVSSIGINRNDSRGRRHFTMWHELYHYLVHDDRWSFQCGSWGHRLGERECNVFAAHVLMPREWVAELQGPLWVAARRLEVSVQALTVRLDELGIRRVE